MRIAVVEDQPETLAAICASVNAETDFTLAGSASTFDDAKRLIANGDFDLLLLDLQLHDISALDLISYCIDTGDANVLVLSALGDESSVVGAIRRGAHGYLLKDQSMRDIGAAIRQVRDGESPLTPAVARHLIRVLHPTTDSSSQSLLTNRELQVLQALANGYTYKEVAARYGLSYHTVVDYTRSLYRKLEVGTRTAAVVAGARRGLISIK
ncbi:MAG: response regulator transcription factor [Pseudomonadota bacterium]